MSEEKELRCQVPRPIRAPKNLAGLTWKGLGLFLSTSLFLLVIVWLLIQWWTDNLLMEMAVKAVVSVMVIGICYQSFKVEEETGEMRVDFILDWLQWRRAEHIVTPEWEGKEDV